MTDARIRPVRGSSRRSLAGWLITALGLFFLGSVLFDEAALLAFGTATDGTITAAERKTVRRGGTDNRPSGSTIRHLVTVSFSDPNGRPVEFTTTQTFKGSIEPGQAVHVIYMPSNPRRAEIFSVRQLWLPLAVGLAASVGCLTLGLVLIRRRSDHATIRR